GGGGGGGRRVGGRRGGARGGAGGWGGGGAAGREAGEYAGGGGAPRQQALMASAYTQAALHGPTPVAEAIEHCERLAADGLNDRQSEALLLCSLAQLRAMRGDFDRARELLRPARMLLEDLGIIVLAPWTAVHWERSGRLAAA